MDFEIDWQYFGISVALWAFCMIPIWGNIPFFKLDMLKLYHKLIISVVLLPMSYIITTMIANRG